MRRMKVSVKRSAPEIDVTGSARETVYPVAIFDLAWQQFSSLSPQTMLLLNCLSVFSPVHTMIETSTIGSFLLFK